MDIAFLPVSLGAIGATISTEQAAMRLVGRDSIRDHEMWAGVVNGQEAFMWKLGGKLVSGPEYEEATRADFYRLQLAYRFLVTALQRAELQAYVWSSQQRACFNVPRFYWNGEEARGRLFRNFEGIEGAAGGDDSMVGQPIMLAEARVAQWLQGARSRFEAEALALEANPAKKPKTNDKPKWYPMLADEFRKAIKRQEDWPQLHPDKFPPKFPSAAEFRRKLIQRGVSENLVPGSTVRYHVFALKQEHGV
jgi:hypothetical protein